MTYQKFVMLFQVVGYGDQNYNSGKKSLYKKMFSLWIMKTTLFLRVHFGYATRLKQLFELKERQGFSN